MTVVEDESSAESRSPSVLDEKPEASVEKPEEKPEQRPDEVPQTPLERQPTATDATSDPQNIVEGAIASDGLKEIRTREDGQEYPSGAKLALIAFALCLAVFLVALDNTIIATAIPKISDQFNSLPDIGWYGSAYLLTTASFQLLFGKFYTFFNIKWVFIAAISTFELGSLLCAVAPSSKALIVGRAIAGLGSAGIFSGGMVIIAYSVPLRQRPIFSGFIGAMYGIASVAGPLLGGVFTDKLTWRWCFYINLPIGGVTLAVITIFFQPPNRADVSTLSWKERVQQLDLLGTAIFMPCIICLLLALQWGGSKYEWHNPRIIVLFVLFAVLLIVYLGIQYTKGDRATVPGRIIRQRSVAGSCFFAFCLGSAFFLMVYYVPVWFQGVLGVSAVQSGIRSLPMVLGLVFVSIISGVMVTVFGYYTPWMIAGSIIMAIGLGLMTTFKVHTGSAKWIGYQALTGMGVGLGMQQPMIAIQTVLDIKDVPIGTAMLIFIQTIGGSIFVSVGQNVFANKLKESLARLVPNLDPALVLNTGATKLQSTIPIKFLPAVLEAYNEALVKAFTVSLIIGAMSIFGSAAIEWKSVKGKKVEMTPA